MRPRPLNHVFLQSWFMRRAASPLEDGSMPSCEDRMRHVKTASSSIPSIWQISTKSQIRGNPKPDQPTTKGKRMTYTKMGIGLLSATCSNHRSKPH